MPPINTAPITSSSPGNGLIPNIGTGPVSAAPVTNNEWIAAFVEYWTARWANGDHTVPNGWVSALHGEPDPTDAQGQASARTILAFTRYAQQYRPGMDPQVDQLMPWQPPGPNDFIEDPVVTAARIANEQWQRTFDESVRQFNLNFSQQERDSLFQIFNSTFQNELTQYATESNIFSTQTQAALQAYNTQAGIYNANEGNRLGALQSAGTLAQTLQGLLDARTNNAIRLQANPNDAVEREYAVRALKGPTGTDVPAYSNVDALSEVIRKLIDYQPNPAPVAPAPMAPPTAPNQGTFQLPPGVQTIINQSQPSPTPSAPTTPAPSAPSPTNPNPIPNPTPSPSTNQLPGHVATGPNTEALPEGYTIGPGGVVMRIPQFAEGTNKLGTTARKMIVGEHPTGKPNPELIEVTGKNVRTKVTPLSKLPKNKLTKVLKHPKFAEGTDLTLKSYDDSAYQNLPSLKYLQGGMSDADYNRLNTGYAPGAFGTNIPESGRINYNKYTKVAKDPYSLALVNSLYRGANRDLASEVSRAKARAPLGQAIATSLIRT